MKTLIFAAMFTGTVGGVASAADLPSATPDQPASTVPATPEQPASSKRSCFDSVWDYLKASVRDCPLRVGPVTFYGNIDVGYGYSLWGAPVGRSADKANYFIQRNSRNVHWLWSPNGASTSVAGLTLAQKLGGGWE